MNKLMVILVALVALCSMSFAQNLRFSEAPSSLNVKPTLVRSFDENDYRYGLAFEAVNIKNLNRTLATGDLWVLTDTRNSRNLFLGAGLSFPVIRNSNLGVSLNLGYSGDFSYLRRPTRTAWGYGLSLSIRL